MLFGEESKKNPVYNIVGAAIVILCIFVHKSMTCPLQ